MVVSDVRRRVVIVGAGFGGLNCARRLARHREFEVIVIDRNPYQLFAPLLYQVATAGLAARADFVVTGAYHRVAARDPGRPDEPCEPGRARPSPSRPLR